MLCFLTIVPPLSTFVHNSVLIPWVLPFGALRTQELISGAQVSLLLTEACKLQLFDSLDPTRSAILGIDASYTSLSFSQSLVTFISTGGWTRSCRTIHQIGKSLHIDEELRALRILFRLINSVSTTGLIAVAKVSSIEDENNALGGCYFNSNPAALFLTTIDDSTDQLGNAIENDATMCGMGIISNHLSVLTRVSSLASSLKRNNLDHHKESQAPTSFVKDFSPQSVSDDDLWGTFAVRSGSFQARVASRVTSTLSKSLVNLGKDTAVVDIGGGSGVFMTVLLKSLKENGQLGAKGLLFDLPNVVDKFPGCNDNIMCKGGSIFSDTDVEDLARVIVSIESPSVVLMFNSFLQHFDDSLAVDIVDKVVRQVIDDNSRSQGQVKRIVVSIVELVTPGTTTPSPYISPSPVHFLRLVWSDVLSPQCSLLTIRNCFSQSWEYFALDSLTPMGRVFSTIMSSLTSGETVEGGEVRSNGFYFNLLQNLSRRIGGSVTCESTKQTILFPLPASLSEVTCTLS